MSRKTKVKFDKISEGKLRHSRKVNSDGMSVPEWIKYHQGKHFCECGCGKEIIIKAHHHNPGTGIPKRISGHNMKTKDAREKASIKCTKQLESGSLKPFTGQEMTGKHHSEATKEQQSESALKWIEENPELAHDRAVKAGSSGIGYEHTDEWIEAHIKRLLENHPMRGKYHTIEARIKDSCSQRGILVDDFDGFCYDKPGRHYDSPEYKQLYKDVFKRDDYTCQMCNKRGGYIELHHILPVRDYPEFILNINNGITLCRDCHRPIYPNEMDYMTEFLGIIFDNKGIEIFG